MASDVPDSRGGRWWRAFGLLGMTRLVLIASTVSGGWLMVYLAFGVEGPGGRTERLDALGLGWSLLAATGATLGLSVCAVALNDVLDRRHDRALERPEDGVDRPVASGRVAARTAVGLAMGGLLVAVASAAALGPMSLGVAVVLGAGVLFYNMAGRFMPAVGIVSLGLLHGLALGLPNPATVFGWPALLLMTHVMGCELLRYVLEQRRPKLGGWGALGVAMGWGFWCLVALGLIRYRQGQGIEAHVSGAVWVGPALAALGMVAAGVWAMRGPSKPIRARRMRRLSAAWPMVYAVGWLASLGLWWPAGSVAVLLLMSTGLSAAGLGGSRGVKSAFIDELTVR